MKLFSRRYHLVEEPYKEQFEEVNGRLRTRIWNILEKHYWSHANSPFFNNYGEVNPIYKLAAEIQANYWILPLDEMGNSWEDYLQNIRKNFFNCKWYKVYDFIEFLISTKFISINSNIRYVNQRIIYNNYGKIISFSEELNQALEVERSAYRLIGEYIVPVSTSVEVDAINQAITQDPYHNVRTHLKAAEKFLSDRTNPDYRNSIKESISAVEAICKIITRDTHATLGPALKKLEDHNIILHKAFKESMLKLYGYTSDEGGIRHCLTDASNIDFADAKYMLVSCSAFCNFLIDKSKGNLGR